MRKELCYMSDILNKEGIVENDSLWIKPFSGKRIKLVLKRTKYDFLVGKQKEHSGESNSIQLDSVQKEKLHFQLTQEETVGRNGKFFVRYVLKSMNMVPFKLNGNYVFESFIEHKDTCEIGYHEFEFIKKQSSTATECELVKFGLAKRIVQSEVPILLEGETGVGKTHLAKRIHELSGRGGQFVHVNLCSFSPSLMESELFGHVKGAFTGAINEKRGALKEAHNGTLFLDEIDSLNIEMQTKLLLFLEDFLVRPVGGMSKQKVSTRVICASGKSLEQMVSSGFMRKDFYFRISSGQSVKLKSLREDPAKIHSIIADYSEFRGVYLAERLIEYYTEQAWPGNIRQLLGHLDKKIALSNSSKISFCEMDDEILKSSALLEDKTLEESTLTLKELKACYAQKTFYKFEKNYVVAAKKLDVSVRTLRRMLVAA